MTAFPALKSKVKNYLVDPAGKTLKNQLHVKVDPCEITYHGYPHPLYFKKYNKYVPQFYISFVNTRIPLIIPKDYQPELTLFSKFRTYKLIKNIREHEFEYSETPEYREMSEQIMNGEVIKIKTRTIQTHSGLNAYFEEYVRLLKNMGNNGYNENISQDDILIWIGPDGELVKDTKSGRHRLAAACVAGLPKVPVRINHIHQKWIESKFSAEKYTTDQLKSLLAERFQ